MVGSLFKKLVTWKYVRHVTGLICIFIIFLFTMVVIQTSWLSDTKLLLHVMPITLFAAGVSQIEEKIVK